MKTQNKTAQIQRATTLAAKSATPTSKTVFLSKTVHLRPLRPSNIIHVKTPEASARIYERNSVIESEFEYKPIPKTAYDSSIYRFQKQKIAKPTNPEELRLTTDTNEPNETEYKFKRSNSTNPIHVAEYSVLRQKLYNQQAQFAHSVPLSKLISREEYGELRENSKKELNTSLPVERGEEADKRNMYRRNFYISKETLDINRDFKFQPLVRNAQTTSEDTPSWLHGTAKFYTKENFDLSKKMRNNINDLPKTDIFGKLDVKYPKADYPFVAKPPSKGQRYELNRMVIVEKTNEGAMSDRKTDNVRLKWEENPDKQSYDRSRLTWKVGDNQRPFIKKLKAKESFNPMIAYKKIGEYDEAQRLKNEKALDLKIGHPNSEYVYPKKKAREDGFLANRKEITSEAFQKSDFFV